jgi:hypothetical protein
LSSTLTRHAGIAARSRSVVSSSGSVRAHEKARREALEDERREPIVREAIEPVLGVGEHPPPSFFGCGKGTVFDARRDCQTPSFPELVIECTSTRPSPEIAGLDR